MRTDFEANVDRARAVFVETTRLAVRRLAVTVFLSRTQRWRIEEWNDFVEESGVPCNRKIMQRDEREPQPVVGASRANTSAARSVPPVLHVARGELSARRPQQMFTRQTWL